MINEPAEPKALANISERSKRMSMLREAHIAELTDYVVELRETNRGNVPNFDPIDGGVKAQILALMEKPGPIADKSSFISRDNNDETAANCFRFWNEAGISRRDTCLWNVIPFWNGQIKISSGEVESGLAHLNRLLGILPNATRWDQAPAPVRCPWCQ